mmetsp:Transcript_21345/g.61222  ORF Transcript_21345/g.61222 Transcript_21345/m.61222 type:complete len:277 (+) Transcript_21345:718-1548(+)
MKAQQTLGPVQIGRTVLEQIHHKHIEPLGVEAPLKLDADALDEIEIVLLLLLFLIFEEVGGVREDGLHVEGIGLEDGIEGSTGALGFNDGGKLIEISQPGLEGLLLILGDEIDLVEQDLIGKGHLLLSFIDGALRLDLVEMLVEVLAVSKADDGIDAVIVRHFGIRLDRVNDGRRVSEASGFEKDGIELLATLGKLAKRTDEISANGTTDTSVVHGDQVLGGIEAFSDESIVNGHLAEFILQDSNLPFILLLENIIHKGGLPGTKEAGDDSDRGQV